MPAAMTWDEFWNWYGEIQEPDRKDEVLREVNSGGWIQRLSVDSQFKVFLHAPLEIKMIMKDYPTIFKRDAIILLQMEEDKKNKKQKRRYTR